MTRLIRQGRYDEDNFTAVADDAPLPQGPVVVSLKRLRAEGLALFERNTPLGVRLKSEESPELLGSDIERLSLVVIEFPKFRDGRGFSWARLLRTRLGFKGEIRAVGDFLYDQLAHMTRVGFDAFEVPDTITPETYARALKEIPFGYQPSSDGRKTIRELRAAR